MIAILAYLCATLPILAFVAGWELRGRQAERRRLAALRQRNWFRYARIGGTAVSDPPFRLPGGSDDH